jgi:CRISPR system Cascade subunit CasE
MFLSKLILNIRDRQARCDLGRPYDMHRTLWRAFPDRDPGRILFRIDADRAGAPPVVLVQSDLRPQWERLDARGARYLLAPPEFKPFQPAFAAGQRLRFRLRANPTKKVASLSKADRLAGAGPRDDATKNGRRLALIREDEQIAWLLHKGEQGGFRIPGEWVAADGDRRAPSFRVDVIPEGWVRCGKEGHGDGRFFAVRFEGLLEVTDPDLFLRTVGDGLGAAKGFGFGLLSVAPVEA